MRLGVPDSGLGREVTRLRGLAPCRYNPALRLWYPCLGDLGDSAMCFVVHPRVPKERASGASPAHPDLRDPLASAGRDARGLLGPQAPPVLQDRLPFLALTGRVSPVGSGPGLQSCPAGAGMSPPLVLSHSYQRSWAPRSTWPPRTSWNHGHLLRGKCPCPIRPSLWVRLPQRSPGRTPQGPRHEASFAPRQTCRSPELWFLKQTGVQGGGWD